MSLRKCDLTGSTDRVEQVHPQIKREGLEYVCFKKGVALEQLRSNCIENLKDYHGFDKAEKLAAQIDSALDDFLNPKQSAKPTGKESLQVQKNDALPKGKKKPNKKK